VLKTRLVVLAVLYCFSVCRHKLTFGQLIQFN
jgi:hypothetical protein